MTDASQARVATQGYTPWGDVRGSDLTQTELDFTGQRKDGTGLLFYNARYYDPKLARFVSPDSLVPGIAEGTSGAGSVGPDEGMALRPLTVDFHEPGFATGVGGENAFTQQKGFAFQLSEEDRQKSKVELGPANPQALNRYSYGLNNPVKYTDPTGHFAAAVALGWAFTSVGITVSAPAIAAILGAVALGAAIGCVLNEYCRGGLLKALRRGGKAIEAFFDGDPYGPYYHPNGPFARNGIPTADHFWERLSRRGISERDAYTNGELYRTRNGQYYRYRNGVAVGVDPDTGEATTVTEQHGPSREWERVDE